MDTGYWLSFTSCLLRLSIPFSAVFSNLLSWAADKWPSQGNIDIIAAHIKFNYAGKKERNWHWRITSFPIGFFVWLGLVLIFQCIWTPRVFNNNHTYQQQQKTAHKKMDVPWKSEGSQILLLTCFLFEVPNKCSNINWFCVCVDVINHNDD